MEGATPFSLKGFRDVNCQITTSGKFSIAFPIEENPENALSIVKQLLVRKNGDPLSKFEKYKEIPEPKKKITPMEEKVDKVITNQRFLLMRDPSTIEIAYEVGETPEKIRETAFKLAPKTKWKEPTEDEIKNAEMKIKEIYQIACLLNEFDSKIVLKRPSVHLGGVSYKTVLKRVKHALDFEKEFLPKIVFGMETDKYKMFRFEWSDSSRFQFTGNPEYYYKQEKKLSGQIGGIMEIFKQAIKGSQKFLEEREK